MTVAVGGEGIERVEAFFTGPAFAPHRHDTYAVGMTSAGVQRFGYRGEQRDSLPGQMIVLHPDERHDGEPGTDGGFRDKIVYIDPALIQAADPGKQLPFVADPILRDPRAEGVLAPVFQGFDEPLCDLSATEMIATIVQGLRLAAGDAPNLAIDFAATSRVRDQLLDADPALPVQLEDLETDAGMDRWQLSRHFRSAFGTSPYRFFQLRRLEKARAAMQRGNSLADVVAATGFADQSHLTRQFKNAYGVSPGRWLALNKLN